MLNICNIYDLIVCIPGNALRKCVAKYSALILVVVFMFLLTLHSFVSRVGSEGNFVKILRYKGTKEGNLCKLITVLILEFFVGIELLLIGW